MIIDTGTSEVSAEWLDDLEAVEPGSSDQRSEPRAGKVGGGEG